jgi:hypothetical protein
LFAWSKDFNPRVQQNVSAQVWVRFYGLSQEYWRPNILFAIASSVGTPICIDAVTAKPMMERTFGQFVRVLVDMDLSQTLRYKVLVERKGFAFFVELDYENLPHFCSHCKVIGHHVGNCKKLKFVEEAKIDKEVKDKRKSVKDGSKIFVQTKDGRNELNVNKEIINVESEKIDEPSKVSKDGEINSAKTVAVEKVGTSTSNKGKSKSVSQVPHQNRFSPLANHSEFTPQTSNHTQPQQMNPSASKSQSQSQPTGQSVRSVPANVSPVLTPVFTPETNLIMSHVLTPNPASTFKAQDLELEVDLNANPDANLNDVSENEWSDSSTQGSFVPASQLVHPKEKQSVTTPERVKRDMGFLKDSWANMVDLEENETNQIIEPVQSGDGFQVRLSKANKKAQKKKIQSSKDSHATRSKVNLKPFK